MNDLLCRQLGANLIEMGHATTCVCVCVRVERLTTPAERLKVSTREQSTKRCVPVR